MLAWYQQLFFRNLRLPFRCRVTYHIGDEPTRLTHMHKGRLRIDDQAVTVNGIVDVTLPWDTITELGFSSGQNTARIKLQGKQTLYFLPYLISVGQVTVWGTDRMRQVYSILHRQQGGAGKCLECGYDLRMSKGQCPDCGCMFVIPVRPSKT
jgi:hypothetical protein